MCTKDRTIFLNKLFYVSKECWHIIMTINISHNLTEELVSIYSSACLDVALNCSAQIWSTRNAGRFCDWVVLGRLIRNKFWSAWKLAQNSFCSGSHALAHSPGSHPNHNHLKNCLRHRLQLMTRSTVSLLTIPPVRQRRSRHHSAFLFDITPGTTYRVTMFINLILIPNSYFKNKLLKFKN